jgi:hypothetical protein
MLVFTLLTPAIAQQAITYRSPEVLNPLPLGKPSAIFAANDGSACLVLQDLDPNEVWRKVSADLVEVTKPTIPFRLGLTTYKVLTVTSQGNVITDRDGISIYSPLGERLQTITFGANGGALLGVDGATVLPDGRTVVLVDNRLQVFSANGTFVTTWGNGKGTAAGFLDVIGTDWSPGLLVSDSKGNVYVSDKNNRRISKWSVTGNFEGAIKLDNLSNPIFWSTGQLAVDANDSIYCVDKNQSCIVKVSAQLSLLWKVSTVGAVDSTLRAPAGVAVVGSSVFVSEAMSHRISKYSTDGLHKSSNRSLVYLPTWPIAGPTWTDVPDSSLNFANFTNPDIDQISRVSNGNKLAWLKVPTIDNGNFVQFRNGYGQRLIREKSNGTSYLLNVYSKDSQKLGTAALGYTRSGNGNGSTWAISDGTTIVTVDSTGAILASRSSDGVTPWANIVACATLSSGEVVAIDYDRSELLFLSPQLQVIRSTTFSGVGISKGIRLAVGADDTLFVLGYLPGEEKVVVRLKADFSHIQTIRLTGVNQNHISLGGLDVAPDLSLVVTDPEGHQIYRFATDTVPPTSTFSTTPSTTWSNSDVTVNITSIDNAGGSGVRDIHYNVNMGVNQVVSGSSVSFTLSLEGIYSVAYWAIDNADNVETTRYGTVRIDKTAPTVDGYVVSGKLMLMASDVRSGVASIKYSLDGAAATDYSAPLTIPAGVHTYSYWSVDYAGNESVKETIIVGSTVTVTIAPTSVYASKAAVATIRLSVAAPAGGVTVMLSSDNPAVTIAPSVKFNAGATTINVPVQTGSVTADTSAVITATIGETEAYGTLTVLVPFPKTLTITPNVITGGSNAVGTVSLQSNAPAGGQLVTLISMHADVTVPTTVIVPAGALTATFAVTTKIASRDYSAAIYAEADGAGVGTTVLVKRVVPKSITFAPSTVPGGNATVGTVTLNVAAPAGGAVLQLKSTSTYVTVPTSVTVAAGQTTATFDIATSITTRTVLANVQATAASIRVSGVLTVSGVNVTSITLAPNSVLGGASTTGTVNLNTNAPTGGLTVQLYTSTGIAGLPSSVTVLAGQKTATFTVTTVPVSANVQTQIVGKYLGVAKTATLTVQAAAVSTVTLNPTSVKGGTNSTMTIKLTGLAGPSGLVVTLTSSNLNAAIVPATVMVPAGTDTVDVVVSTKVVTANATSTLTAKTGAGSKTVVLTVTK